VASAEVVDAAVAVIVRDDGKVLLGQRPEGKPWSGWWEFPGGKIERGETAVHALQRELHEELGIEAIEFSPWLTRRFAYPERTVRLHFFTVRKWLGVPHGREGQQLSWESPASPSVGPLLPANAPVLEALRLPPVYAITNLLEMGETAFFAALERALQNGLRLIQVREKQLDGAALTQFAQAVAACARPCGARVVINGDIALARAAGADGVHLPSAALMACGQKPRDLLCGASCHNAAELVQAAGLELDYALLAPVQATRTHPGTAPMGWSNFSDLARNQPLPIYALGGMAPQDLPVAWQCGAHGVAMMRALWQ
jgi:8-oxo-dGTP diphosphatase